jgi:O-antigen ligase
VKNLVREVWHEAPVQGLGFASAVTLDNAYVEFLFQGGVIGLAGYVAVLGVMGWIGLSHYVAGREEGRLLLCCFVFLVGAGVGAPVLTINRFSTAFWVFFVSLLFLIDSRQRERISRDTSLAGAPPLNSAPA